MIRLQDNTPAYYIEQSRDFQLLCRLFDIVNFSGKNNADALATLLQPELSKSTLLKLLCAKAGFISNFYLDDDILRNIAAAFPFIVKRKGTLQGIALAVNTVLKAENKPQSTERIEFVIDNTNYKIIVLTPITLYNKVALLELFKYVVPTGIDISIQTYTAQGNIGQVNTTIYQKDMYDIISLQTILSSMERSSSSEYPTGVSINTETIGKTVESRMLQRFDTMQIVSSKDIEEDN